MNSPRAAPASLRGVSTASSMRLRAVAPPTHASADVNGHGAADVGVLQVDQGLGSEREVRACGVALDSLSLMNSRTPLSGPSDRARLCDAVLQSGADCFSSGAGSLVSAYFKALASTRSDARADSSRPLGGAHCATGVSWRISRMARIASPGWDRAAPVGSSATAGSPWRRPNELAYALMFGRDETAGGGSAPLGGARHVC